MGRAGLLELGDLERLPDGLVDDAGVRYLGVPLRHWLERVHHVERLMTLLVESFETALARNRHERGLVEVRVGDARQQVGRARPERGEADASISGQSPPDVGHEGRALFVARGGEGDVRVPEGEQQCLGLLARNPEDVLDVLPFHPRHQHFCGVHGTGLRRATP